MTEEDWKEVYNESGGGSKKKLAAVAVAVVVIAAVFIAFLMASGRSGLEASVNSILDNSRLTLPGGTRILVEFYDDSKAFTGERFIVTENRASRYDGGGYDLKLATNIKNLDSLRSGDFCTALRGIYLEEDYTYEITGDVSKYAGLESCVR